jgi:hypothetical protein
MLYHSYCCQLVLVELEMLDDATLLHAILICPALSALQLDGFKECWHMLAYAGSSFKS